MKLKDLIERVVRNNDGPDYCDFHNVAEEFQINDHWDYDDDAWESNVHEYWIAPWYCTDTWVGLSVIYYQDTPVCVVMQTGRKCSREYHWISAETRTLLFNFVKSIISDKAPDFILADLEEEWDDKGYQISFGSQCLAFEVMYQGKMLSVDKTWNRYPNWVKLDDPDWGKIALLSETGERIIVEPKDIYIPYRIT